MNVTSTDGDVQLALHHIGFAVPDIEEYLASSLWTPRSEIVFDPIQQCRLCLVGASPDDEPLVELVEPVGETSPALRAAESRQRQYHLCFSVETMEAGDRVLHQQRMLPVTSWQPAVLFGGRHVRFAYTRNRELTEFLANE